jgi:hypothetical protein
LSSEASNVAHSRSIVELLREPRLVRRPPRLGPLRDHSAKTQERLSFPFNMAGGSYVTNWNLSSGKMQFDENLIHHADKTGKFGFHPVTKPLRNRFRAPAT